VFCQTKNNFPYFQKEHLGFQQEITFICFALSKNKEKSTSITSTSLMQGTKTEKLEMCRKSPTPLQKERKKERCL